MKTQNTIHWFINTKVHLLLSLIHSHQKERSRLWTGFITLDRPREINHCKMREANTGLGIILHSQHSIPSWYSGCHHFWSIFTSGLQLTSFSCFLFYISFNGFLFEFLQANQSLLADCSCYFPVFNLGVCCYHDLHFRNLPLTFLFISSLLLCFSRICPPFSTVFWLTSKSS